MAFSIPPISQSITALNVEKYIPCSTFYLVQLVAQEEIAAIKNSMDILKGNQDTLSNQIKQTFNFGNQTYTETKTNRLLFKSLQKDIVLVNTTVQHLSKELKTLIYNRYFFIIMLQLRSHLVTFHNEIHFLKVDIPSILNQMLVKHSQKLTPHC